MQDLYPRTKTDFTAERVEEGFHNTVVVEREDSDSHDEATDDDEDDFTDHDHSECTLHAAFTIPPTSAGFTFEEHRPGAFAIQGFRGGTSIASSCTSSSSDEIVPPDNVILYGEVVNEEEE